MRKSIIVLAAIAVIGAIVLTRQEKPAARQPQPKEG